MCGLRTSCFFSCSPDQVFIAVVVTQYTLLCVAWQNQTIGCGGGWARQNTSTPGSNEKTTEQIEILKKKFFYILFHLVCKNIQNTKYLSNINFDFINCSWQKIYFRKKHMQQVAKISVYKNKYTRRKKQSDALNVLKNLLFEILTSML